jgi:CYTH domain-containing protein/CHAD domain-containing protein
VRAYKEPLRGGGVSGKHRDALRAVARATSLGRDAEVHVEWLRARREFFGRGRRHGTEWLIKRLEAQRLAATGPLAEEVGRTYLPVHDKLASRLKGHARPTGDGAGATSFGSATAVLLRDQAEVLRERIAAVRGPGDREAGHAARIAAKHLRYLLEPLAREVPGAEALVSRLRELQDVLGAFHDAHVFGGEIAAATAASAADQARKASTAVLEGAPRRSRLRRAEPDPARPGLQAIERRLRLVMEESFASFAKDWTSGAADDFWGEIARLATRLRARGGRSTEIERKYLLSSLPKQVRRGRALEIVQGYLPGERLVERLRRVKDDGGTSFYRTVKLGRGIVRTEVEEETTRHVFDRMWPLTRGRRLNKRRWEIPDGALTWQVDEFTDRRLVLAEVELPAEDTAVEIPKWLRAHVVREVTGEDAYQNAQLAR